MYKTIAIIVAGGCGARFGSNIPKQYIRLKDGKSIIETTITAFLNSKRIDAIQVVIGDGHEQFYTAIDHHKLLPTVCGGKSRSASVLNALVAIEKFSPKFVLIHDAVRPFVSTSLIEDVIAELKIKSAVIPAMKMTDSIVEANNNIIKKHVPRDDVYAVQTPQGFHFIDILKCHKLGHGSSINFTDDSALAHRYNIDVAIVPGDYNNIKITFQGDLNECN